MALEPNKLATVPILLLTTYGIIVVEVHEYVCTNSDCSDYNDSGGVSDDAMDRG